MAVEDSGSERTISGTLSEKEVAQARPHSTLRFISLATMVAATTILVIGLNIAANHNLVGWVTTLAIAASMDVVAWLLIYPRKHNKLWMGLAIVGAVLPVFLLITGVTGRTTNLSAQEKQAVANAAAEQDAKTFTHVIEVVDPNCTVSATAKDWGDAVRYQEGDTCTLKFDLRKASVTVFGTEGLGKVEDSDDILTIPVKKGHFPKFYLNVADYPGGKQTIPDRVLKDSSEIRFYAKR